MPLTDMNALAAAWLAAPLLLIGSSCGIGLLVSSISNLRLGAATAPAGLLSMIVVVNTLLWLRLPAALVTALVVIGALIGLWIGYRRVMESRRARTGEHTTDAGADSNSNWNPVVTGSIAATVVWIGGMLPIVLMGRLGVLGYILNNDAAIHIAVVEVLRDHGAAGLSDPSVSTDVAGGLYTTNYPTGGQVPALIAAMLTKSPGFHIWSPVLVTCMAMIALVATHLHKRFGSPQGIALIGSILAGGGYLVYSYMLQGGMKEVLLALAIPAIAALAILARERDLAPRTLLPVALGIASLPSVMSLGGFAWLAPAALAFGTICVVSPPAGLSRLKTLAIVLAIGLAACVMAAPAIVSSVAFTSENSAVISDQDQIGNLLGPVPWKESLGVWFSHDYRSGQPQFFPRINSAFVVVLFALALIGLGTSIRRRNWELPLAVFSAASAALLLTVKYSIYFEAKAYVVLAPLMALAVGFGLTTIHSLPPLRRPAIALTGVIAVAALLSTAFTYPTVWFTPQQRFEDLASISDRLAGKGGVLVSDREDYARVILERNNTRQPWQSYPTAVLGMRNPGLIGDSTITADVDDYLDDLLGEVNWIVDRHRPAGSLATRQLRAGVGNQLVHGVAQGRTGPSRTVSDRRCLHVLERPIRLSIRTGGSVHRTGTKRPDSRGSQRRTAGASAESRSSVLRQLRNRSKQGASATAQPGGRNRGRTAATRRRQVRRLPARKLQPRLRARDQRQRGRHHSRRPRSVGGLATAQQFHSAWRQARSKHDVRP